MTSILGAMLAKIGWTLLTERVLKEVFVNTAWYFAKRSTNDLDDKHVKTMAEALGVKVD